MDLLDQLRDMRDREAAIIPRPGSSDYGDETREALIDMAANLVMAATDEELLRSYQRTGRQPGSPESELLLTEIERRGLNV